MAVFYALYFGQDHLRLHSAAAWSFVGCFVTYETRTWTVTEYDENDEPYKEVSMKKIEITLSFDEEKLEALEFSLRKEKSSVQKKMQDELTALYEQSVPEAVREYLERKSVPVRERPRRNIKAKGEDV